MTSLRLVKEKAMYEKEITQQETRIAKMKAEGKDEHDIKKQVHDCWGARQTLENH